MFRVICHLDMDAFFASIEQRDSPHLRGQPVIVGASPEQRGVACAASYEARKFGVRSAMASSIAKRLCPNAVFIAPRMDHYRGESLEIMKILTETGACVEQTSVDEAYIDLTGLSQGQDHDAALRCAVPIAIALKRRIKSERRLTASVGIGSNKLLAKIASDFQKPDGLQVILESQKVQFLRTLPIRALHGVGEVTERKLKAAGLNTISHLQDYPGDLRRLVGSFGLQLKEFALGEDDRVLEIDRQRDSITSQFTFSDDTLDSGVLFRCLWDRAVEIAGKLKKEQLAARTVKATVRYKGFTTNSVQITLTEPVREERVIYYWAALMVRREQLLSREVRMLGVSVHHLCEPNACQLELL